MRCRGNDDEGICPARDSFQGIGLGEEGSVDLVLVVARLVAEEGRLDREGRRRQLGIWGRLGVRLVVIVRLDEGVRRELWRLVGVERGGRLTMAPAATDWITLAEASEILEASNVRFRPETIGSWARAGKLQSIKLGGRRFVRRGEVKALVAGPRRVKADDLQASLFEELQR